MDKKLKQNQHVPILILDEAGDKSSQGSHNDITPPSGQ